MEQRDITLNGSIDIINPTRVTMEIGAKNNKPPIVDHTENLKEIQKFKNILKLNEFKIGTYFEIRM